MNSRLQGLIAATHTPFLADGELNLSAVEKQADHLLRTGVSGVFIGGSTGESQSLTVAERLALAQRWSEVVRNSSLRLIVHVGSNCLADSRALASQAQSLGVAAISAVAPSYFKPKSLETLIACCEQIAGAAPSLPFYYYDIPPMTGVYLPMADFLDMAAERIPTLAGLKFSNFDLMMYQRCLHSRDGRFDVPWGIDEYLLAALAVGAIGAVGSSYNFATPIYTRMMAAFSTGDLATARIEQYRSVRLIQLLAEFGYMAASKSVMAALGVDVGLARLPNANLTVDQHAQLLANLERLGFFDSVRV
ncbi:dihydrodipicolinate synthase family protein [Zavarzinella formosa]|uniref:dihydrodipicolinate synthase family protein n=1 Tax=Zavarzinella formosa TaxID=360055 RepID=UPI00031337D2|nr:dihydrodipicolinate synthase family protein [Zavarzinella formosa]